MNNPARTLKTTLTRPRTLSVFILAVWAIYLTTSPFYIFPKGRPQPADYLLILTILPFLATQFLTLTSKIKPLYLLGGLFVLVTIVVNIANYVLFPDIRFILTAMIYPYNFLVFIFVALIAQRNPPTFKKVTYYAIIASIILQLITVQFFDFGYRGYRGTGGFENPNQFAYWSILTATMLIFIKRGETLKPLDFILLAALGLIQTLALSKAGIIAYSIFLIFLFITPKISKKTYLTAGIILIIGTLYTLASPSTTAVFYNKRKPLQNAVARIGNIGQEADDSPEARGYFRITQNPLYSIVGSGEGAFWRFNKEGYNRELHSGIATIIFSYGVAGTLTFFGFLILVMNRQPWHYILLFTPILLFGLPHQNFRFAHFWVLLGINYGLAEAHRNEKPRIPFEDNTPKENT